MTRHLALHSLCPLAFIFLPAALRVSDLPGVTQKETDPHSPSRGFVSSTTIRRFNA